MRETTRRIVQLFCLLSGAAPATAQIASHIVISELYGSGGNIGAVYRNDYIELYNPTSDSVSLAGWSIQYGSATGTGTWRVAPLGGTIQAFGYYLIQLAGGANGLALPPPDTTGSINLSSTSGKVALVRDSSPLSGANPSDPAIIDKVGYGSANGYEGSGPAPGPGTVSSIERKARPLSTAESMAPGGADSVAGNGWDSDDNAKDFVAQSSMSPQNSGSPPERPPADQLPIQIAEFKAVIAGPSLVAVSWSTISEVSNYGFEVQKSDSAHGAFLSISGLIPGHGTTLARQDYSFLDTTGTPGRFYRLKQIDFDNTIHYTDAIEAVVVEAVPEELPRRFILRQNFPNPFNPSTAISYQLPSPERVKLAVFDILGRSVHVLVDGRQDGGNHTVTWYAGGVPAGVYFCRLEAAGEVQTRKLVLVR